MRYILCADGSPSPLEIRDVGYAEDPRMTRFGPARRNLYLIHYVLEGEGSFNGAEVHAGQGFLISPGGRQLYFPKEENPWKFMWFISYDKTVLAYFDRLGADPQTGVFDFDLAGLPTLKRMAEFVVNAEKRVYTPGQTLEMFLHALNVSEKQSPRAEDASQTDLYLSFAVKYIETHINQPVTVGELTKLLGISQPYLHKIFRQKYKMSPKQYILSGKLLHAKKLLDETDLSVTEVSRSVGYDDVLTFSRMFTRKEQISPQHYRENRRLAVRELAKK